MDCLLDEPWLGYPGGNPFPAAQPRLIQAARGIVARDLIGPGPSVSSPVKHWRHVVKQSIRSSKGRPAIAADIPRQSQPGRKFEPGIFDVGIEAWIQRVARVLKSRRRILEDRALDSLVEPFSFEMHRPAQVVGQCMRLPAQ